MGVRSVSMKRRLAGLAGAFVWAACAVAPLAMAQSVQPTILEYPQTSLKGFISAEIPKSQGECHKICEERTGCAGFDYSSIRNMCRLYAAVQGAQPDPSFLAGSRNRIPNYSDPANLAPPPELEQWHYARYSNVDLFGGDIVAKGIEMFDSGQCESRCEQDRSCKAFTFNREQDRCFLKSGYQFVQSASGVESGLYFRAKPSEARKDLDAEWELFLKSDIPGNDLEESGARTYPQCMQSCEANRSCSGFTWVYFTRQDHCYLKMGQGLYPQRNDRGVVSARKTTLSITPDFIRPVANRD
ncbi:hypothetical protein E0H32_32610 [Rhizobium leguminosarum bv. viciae]|nr:hypothetical protein E0H32_32610 [Rhizobium leguminosarum bv. viciae]